MMKILSKVIALIISASLVLAMPVFAVENNTEPEAVETLIINEESATPDSTEDVSVDDEDLFDTQSEEETTEAGDDERSETVSEDQKGSVETERATEADEETESVSEELESTADTEKETFEETEVEVVYSIDELVEKTQAAENESFFTVDAATGYVEGNAEFEDLGEASYEEVVADAYTDEECVEAVSDYLKDTGLYSIENVEDTSVDVVSVFSNQRLSLRADEADYIQTYGALKAIYYNDSYTFEYDSADAAKTAYQKLVEDHGNSVVLIDYPVKVESNGWGVDYMNFETPMLKNDDHSGKVSIAVVDTGVNIDHEIFKDTTLAEGFNILSKLDSDPRYHDPSLSSNDVTDNAGHGTSVAGIIAESVPSNVSIMPIKVQDGNKDGSLWNLVLAARYADEQGVDIINMSLGATLIEPDKEGNVDEEAAREIYDTLDRYLSEINALIISASGNENCDMDEKLCVPASLPYVISVGAIDDKGNRYSKSNYGEDLDFVGPGVSVKCANSNNVSGTVSKTGTSIATPYVASVAALLKAGNKSLSNDEIVSKISEMCVDLGEKGPDIYYGNGCPVFSEVDEITLNNSGVNLKVGGIKVISSTIKPENAYNKKLKYSSSNSAVASVDANGKITGKKPGTATITVSATDGSGVSASCKVSVKAIPLSETTASLAKTSYSYTGAAIKPGVTVKYSSKTLKKGTDYTVSYSNNIKVGTGKVKITGKGNYSGSITKTFKIKALNGWITKNGKKYYYKNNKTLKGWQKISGYWYFFETKNGVMLKGWQQIKGNKYYLGKDGKMVRGWLKYNKAWYYLGYANDADSGLMRTGWLKDKGKWYYLRSNGKMVTGKQTISGKTYYFDKSGKWIE